MPNMANITVKKADGTTDVVYTALTPSAGDKTSARWSLTAFSTKANLRPTLECTSRYNNARTARNISMTLKFPEIASVAGVDSVIGTGIVTIQGVVPLQVSDSVISELIAQSANVFKTVLVQDSFKIGYAPQ